MSTIVEAPNASRQKSLGSLNGKRARVLFVDDDERILRALQSMFRLEYNVSITTNGRLVGDMLKREHFHIIVSDQRMPEVQGIEVLRTAREVSPNTMRLLLTGFADLAAIVGSVNEGEIFRYISKPWDNAELSEIIADAASIGIALANSTQQSSHKSAATPPLRAPSAGELINVLYIDRQGQLIRECKPDLVNGLHAIWAAGPEEALDIMQKHAVSMVVAAVDREDKANIDFLNILKVKHPHIVAIVVASAADSALLIGLIHTVRIFRVIFRPIKPGVCQMYFAAALKQVMSFRNAPTLLMTQRTSPNPGTVSLLANIGQRLQSVKSFFQ